MAITAGGTLNVGGLGYMSHLKGAQVDHALELDVVTGDGRLLTCSPDRESELFNMVLGGQGQCGIIVRAKLRLELAPSHVILQTLAYNDLDQFVMDQLLAAKQGRTHHLVGRAGRQPDGSWRFTLEVGHFYTAPEESDLAAVEAGLHFDSRTEPVRMTYRDYLFKNEPRWAAMQGANGLRPAPSIVIWMPASGIREMLSDIFALSREQAGFGGIGLYSLNTLRFTRPLLKMPSEELAFGIWLFRVSPMDNQAALSTMLESNRTLLAKMASAGGKRYAPYSGVATREEWMVHFGPEVYQRFSAAKKKYDAKAILAPEPGIFRDRDS